MPPKYRCNHRFFEHIDTEPKAYWLGFLAADGCVGSAAPVISLSLSERDLSQVEGFRAAIGSEHPIRRRPYSKSSIQSSGRTAAITVYSRAMAEDLSRNGVLPRKTFTLRWPVLERALLPHYLRGYFDGDGCFTNAKRAGSLTFSLAGNRQFLTGCQEYLISSCDLKRTELVPMRTTPEGAYLMYCGTGQVKVIAAHLYEGASIWLDRKRQVVDAATVTRGQYGKPSIQTRCKNGHEFTPENTLRSAGRRVCRECSRLKCAAWRARNPDYLTLWRADHPEQVAAQRERQNVRRRQNHSQS